MTEAYHKLSLQKGPASFGKQRYLRSTIKTALAKK